MKLKNKIVALVLSVVCVMPFAACGERGGGEDLNKPTDNTKTQLSVFNYDGGFGNEWLKKARDRFEAEYADTEFEPGKKGVQITISPQKINGTDLKDRMNEDLFFGEQIFYNDYVKSGKCLDITDIVKDETLPGEQKTIKDKMSVEQYAYFEQNNGKVYGIPHYLGTIGIVYNIDFFDDNDLYFKQNWKASPDDPFTSKTASNVSKGPDGIESTADDGLPVTYEEFYKLCDYIATDIPSAKPLIWNGVAHIEYLLNFMNSLYADYEGQEQRQISYTFNGTLKHVVDSINGNQVKLKDPISITPESQNGYEAYAQAGKYYALSFVETILKNTKWYDANSVFTQSFSHLEAQKTYLLTEEFGGRVDYAMMIEGCWWESEVDSFINQLVQKQGESASKYSRNFGWMPLPRPEESSQKATMFDHILSCAFIKSNIAPSKIPAAKAFLQFVNTDESLVEFTNVTNTAKALNYTMSDKSKLSNFGKSFIAAKENSDIMYSYNGSDIYRNNASMFTINRLFQSNVGGTLYQNPIDPLRNGISAKSIFEGCVLEGKNLFSGLDK